MDSTKKWTQLFFFFLCIKSLHSLEACNCLLRSGENLKEPLIIRSFCYDDFAWKVFVRSDKSDVDFKDSKNQTYNRYDVRVTKVYKDSKNTSVFSEGFIYAPHDCTITLPKTRFVVIFGFYDKIDGKPVVSECTFNKLIDDLNVGERLFLMGAYRRMDCLERYSRPPSPGAPGSPGRPASVGFAGPPYIPGWAGMGGIGGHGGMPGVGEHGILGGYGGTGGTGGISYGTGVGGSGGSGGSGGPGSRNNKLEYTKDLEALQLREVPKEEEINGIIDEKKKVWNKKKKNENRVKRETNEETTQTDTLSTTETTAETTLETTDVHKVPSHEFGGPSVISVKPSLHLSINTPPPLGKDHRKFKEERLRWPLGRPQSSWNAAGAQGWTSSSTESPGMSADFNLCSIPSFMDLPQCLSNEWDSDSTPRPQQKKKPPKQVKPQQWGWNAPQQTASYNRPEQRPPPDQWDDEWEEPRTQRPIRAKPRTTQSPEWDEWEEPQTPPKPRPRPQKRPNEWNNEIKPQKKPNFEAESEERPPEKPKKAQKRPNEGLEWEERPHKGKQPLHDTMSCSCDRLRALEESCSSTFAETLNKFFNE